MEEAADEGHEAGDEAAEDRVTATGERAVVGEAFGEGHGDAGAYGGGCSDEEDGAGVVGGEGGGEDGGEGGDGAVHEAGEARLHDAQDEALIVADRCWLSSVRLGMFSDMALSAAIRSDDSAEG